MQPIMHSPSAPVHFDSARIRCSHPRPFAIGLYPQPERVKRSPVTLADLAAYADIFACPADAPTVAECEARYRDTTFSAEEREYAVRMGVTLPAAREMIEDARFAVMEATAFGDAKIDYIPCDCPEGCPCRCDASGWKEVIR